MSEIYDKQDLKRLYKLMHQYEKQLIQFAYSYIGDMEASEDYVLESFMEFWSNRHTIDGNEYSNIPAYILTVVKHKCLNHLRHRKNQESASDQIKDYYKWELDMQINSLKSCEPKELFTNEIYEIVENTLKKFSKEAQRIFYLSRFENKSRKEIAQVMNLSVKGVEYHIAKILTALRRNLKDYLS